MFPRARKTKERINKWDFTKYIASEWVKKNSPNKKGTNYMGKFFANDYLGNGWMLKMYKEFT